MKAFGGYHPAVTFTYFISVLLTAMFVWNPVIQLTALLGGIMFSLMLVRKKAILSDMGFYLPLFLLVAVTNPLFSHNGVTPLFFMNGNPVTLEAVVYGVFISVMVVGVLFWCKCYNEIMTEDKFLYLFGRIVPMFKRQMKNVSRAQKAMGLYSQKSYVDRLRGGIRVFTAMISWSLQNPMELSSSMRARGYGLHGRTNFSLFKFGARDAAVLLSGLLLFAAVLIGVGSGSIDFTFYPEIGKISLSLKSLITYISFFILSFLPFFIEVKENLKWKYYISKI